MAGRHASPDDDSPSSKRAYIFIAVVIFFSFLGTGVILIVFKDTRASEFFESLLLVVVLSAAVRALRALPDFVAEHRIAARRRKRGNKEKDPRL